jgi:thymidylate synthase (FAD)
LLRLGIQAQAARGILPNDLKTEINVKANLREWRTIFKLRTAPSAHPDMRRVMIPLLQELKNRIPIIFDDIRP